MGKKNKQNAAKSANRWRTGMLNKKERKAMERYGLNANDYAFEGQSYRHDKKSYDQMRDDFVRAASNDYDTRRGIEALAMSGNKKAKKLAKGGFSNPADVMNANNIQMKEHRRAGNGGDFSSRSDFAGTSFRSVQKDRDNFASQFVTKEDMESYRDELANKKTTEPQGPIEHSSAMAAANASVGNDHDMPRFNPQASACDLFLNDYKDDVKCGARITENSKLNLLNAAMRTSIA